ncbi:MAG: hypothetical protein GEU81_05760 [Nitriliruptorales bacterium]|nr:hypothetical protein [Nitriliruptorales bacterium]
MPPRSGPRTPSYGPRGYLPERAAHRARKIILREQMGLAWPLAAAGAGILLAVVGIAFLLRSGPPGEPYAPAGEIAAVARNAAEVIQIEGTDQSVLTVRGGGTVRTFAAPEEPLLFCQESRRLESPSGAVWTLEGILVGGGGQSLRPAPSLVYDGVLYIDTEALRTAAPPPASPRGETTACRS